MPRRRETERPRRPSSVPRPPCALRCLLLPLLLAASDPGPRFGSAPVLAAAQRSPVELGDGSLCVTCDGGRCIAPRELCNGVQDCQDGADEALRNCQRETQSQRQGEAEGEPRVKAQREAVPPSPCARLGLEGCPQGPGCVEAALLCDGRKDCVDGSDEGAQFCAQHNCSLTGRVKCPPARAPAGVDPAPPQCTPPLALCDGTPSCPQGTDEDPAFCARHTCSNGTIRCPGGLNATCFPGALCDGVRNCPEVGPAGFRSDEDPAFCRGYTCPPGEAWKCGDGLQCVANRRLCDGARDCPDGSDEDPSLCLGPNPHDRTSTAAPQHSIPCFRCDGGRCLNPQLVCDRIEHCRDGTDEGPWNCGGGLACARTGRMDCPAPNATADAAGPGHRQCMWAFEACNGKEDCPGGADETDEFCAAFKCPHDELECPSGVGCVPDPSSLCNGVEDCRDGSDEGQTFCAAFNCSAINKVLCPSGAGCVAPVSVCDGVADCADTSDESAYFCLGFNCSATGRVPCPAAEAQPPECVSPLALCDGNRDCRSGSDEGPAFCAAHACPEGKVKCRSFAGPREERGAGAGDTEDRASSSGSGSVAGSGNAIAGALPELVTGPLCVWGALCDGVHSCRGQPGGVASDEDPAFCRGYACPEGQWKCRSQVQCVGREKLCNGHRDCSDGSDEAPTLCSSFNCSDTGRVPCPSGTGYCMESYCMVCRENAPLACPDGSDQWESSCHLRRGVNCSDWITFGSDGDCPPGAPCRAQRVKRGNGGNQILGGSAEENKKRRKKARRPLRKRKVKRWVWTKARGGPKSNEESRIVT